MLTGYKLWYIYYRMINLNSMETAHVKALARLREPGYEKLLEVLQLQLEETKAQLVAADETARIHRLQGRAQAFDDLLKAVNDAVKVESRR